MPGIISNMVSNLGPCLVSDYMFYISPELFELEGLDPRERALLSGRFIIVTATLTKIIVRDSLFPIATLRKKIKMLFLPPENLPADMDQRLDKWEAAQACQTVLGIHLTALGVLNIFSINSSEIASFIALGGSFLYGAWEGTSKLFFQYL